MKKRLYVIISIVFLSVIFIKQFNYINNNTMGSFILNPKIKEFSNDNNYEIMSELTNILLKDVNKEQDKNILLITNSDTAPYKENVLEYLTARIEALPLNMNKYGFNYQGKTDFIEAYDLDYILLLGKNTKLYNIVSENDYTLYKVTNKEKKEIKEISSVKFGLIDVYRECVLNNDYTKINYYVKKYQNQVLNNYNVSAIELLKNFVVDLYEYGYYDEAIRQSNFYLENVHANDSEINISLGYIYKSKNNFDKAYRHFERCTYDSNCDIKTVTKEMNSIKVKGGV